MATILRPPIFSPVVAVLGGATLFIAPNLLTTLLPAIPLPPGQQLLVDTKYRVPPDAGSVSGTPLGLLTASPPLPVGAGLLVDTRYRAPLDAGAVASSPLSLLTTPNPLPVGQSLLVQWMDRRAADAAFTPPNLLPFITSQALPPGASLLVDVKYRIPPDAGSVWGTPLGLLVEPNPVPIGQSLLVSIKYVVPPDAGAIYPAPYSLNPPPPPSPSAAVPQVLNYGVWRRRREEYEAQRREEEQIAHDLAEAIEEGLPEPLRPVDQPEPAAPGSEELEAAALALSRAASALTTDETVAARIAAAVEAKVRSAAPRSVAQATVAEFVTALSDYDDDEEAILALLLAA